MSESLVSPEDGAVKQEPESDILDPKYEVGVLEDIIKTEEICSEEKFQFQGVKLERSCESVPTLTDILKKEQENDPLDTKYETSYLEDKIKTEDVCSEDETFQFDNEHVKLESSSSESVTANTDVSKKEQVNDLLDTEYEISSLEDNIKTEDICSEDEKFQLDNESVKLESSSSESDTEKVKKQRKRYRKLVFQCDKCGETIPWRSNYIRHCRERHDMQVKEIKSYICELCPRRFQSSSSLYRHMQYHVGVTCEEYDSSNGIWGHKLMTRSDPKKCKNCSQQSPIKSIHDSYTRWHTDYKRFECIMCHKRFVTKWDLGRHMISHNSVKEFKCPCCEKEYKRKRDLKIHTAKFHDVGADDVKVPSKGPTFVCNICPKAYWRRNDLTIHLYTHSSEKPFACTICDKKFSYKASTKQHMKTMHNVKIEPLE